MVLMCTAPNSREAEAVYRRSFICASPQKFLGATLGVQESVFGDTSYGGNVTWREVEQLCRHDLVYVDCARLKPIVIKYVRDLGSTTH